MLAQVRAAVKQAYAVTAPFQASVTLTHRAYGDIDPYDGTRDETIATQTLNALIGPIRSERVDDQEIERCTLYCNDEPLTLTLAIDDTAAFNGQTWRVEGPINATAPEFVRAVNVRRP